MDTLDMTYLSSIKKEPLLTPGQEQELFSNITPAAKEKIIKHNMRLVCSIAKKYAPNDDLLMDYIQEGTIGLIDAIDRFDINRGFKFSTYAIHYIKRYIILYAYQNKTCLKIPRGTMAEINKIQRLSAEYEKKTGKKIPVNELVKLLDQPESKIQDMQELIQRMNTTSLDISISNDDESLVLEDTVQDDSVNIEEDTVETIYKDDLKNIWYTIQPYVTKRQLSILEGVYKNNKKLTDISKDTLLPYSTISYDHGEALRKLRMDKPIKALQERYEVSMQKAYKGSITSFKTTFTSSTEKSAMKLYQIWLEKGDISMDDFD